MKGVDVMQRVDFEEVRDQLLADLFAGNQGSIEADIRNKVFSDSNYRNHINVTDGLWTVGYRLHAQRKRDAKS